MPSPFPGMDPYIEGQEWMSFHAEFCVEIARQLRPLLRPRYLALTVRRFVTDTPEDLAITSKSDSVYPDVGVVERSPVPLPQHEGFTAVLEPTLQAATLMPEMVPQYAVEIRDVEERRLVTLIEVLSPANKRGEGYQEYVEKRTRILLSTTHLLEIDLLRNGSRVPMRDELPESPYFVFLSRWQRRPITDIWEVGIDQTLPTVPIPLLPADKDVALDLQLAFTTVYDSIGYDLLLDYTRPADVPLKGKAAKWAAERLASTSK
ncbi:MAG: DUF4058 family protein [Caldilineaceae bacterium]